jgi:hypothetical protein
MRVSINEKSLSRSGAAFSNRQDVKKKNMVG